MLTYMLDTNTIIYTMKNRPAGMQERFNRLVSQLCISSITAAELCFGVEKARGLSVTARISKIFSRVWKSCPTGLKPRITMEISAFSCKRQEKSSAAMTFTSPRMRAARDWC